MRTNFNSVNLTKNYQTSVHIKFS